MKNDGAKRDGDDDDDSHAERKDNNGDISA